MTAGPAVLTPVGPQAWQIASGVFQSNCYVHAADDARCVLIDPGLDPQAIDRELGAIGLTPVAVLCTHGHFDHVGGAFHFQDKYGIPVHLPQADMATMKGANFLLMALRIPARIALPRVTPIPPGSTVAAGGAQYRYLPCPGHTPGSSIICIDGYGFSGDSLYARGVGLSKLPGEDHGMLRASILSLWETLPGSMIICPGHGSVASWDTIRHTNTALREFLSSAGKAVDA